MTPEQLAMVRASYGALGPDMVTVAMDFYRRLFEIDASAKDLFTNGPEVMASKFADELHALVEAISSFTDFASRARDLGARHADYRVQTRHYHAAREALIGALAAHLAEQWDEQIEAAWRRAYNLVAEMMMTAAAGVERQQRAH
jgi:hemoglobin-like flavoprotein